MTTVDERTFPAATTVRFVLLVMLLALSSSSMLADVVAGLYYNGHDTDCILAAGADPNRNVWAISFVADEQRAAFDACLNRFSRIPPWWFGVIWPILLFSGAAVLFAVLPRWKGRAGRVIALDTLASGAPVRSALAALVDTSGLDRTPRFVVDPAVTSAGAAVFGRNDRPVVCLQAGLLARRVHEPHRFRAVVLHELAHIRNRDITVTYLTIAVWRVFVVGVLVPYISWCTWELVRITTTDQELNELPYFLGSVPLSACLVGLVYLARSEVLRSREVHADLAAVRWGADPRGWVVDVAPEYRGRWAQVRGDFVQLWRSHPRWTTRQQALVVPAELFGVHRLPMLLTGIAAALIDRKTSSLLWGFATGPNGGVWAAAATDYLPAVISGGFVTAVAAMVLIRAVWFSVLTSRPPPSGLSAGLWLGTGLVLGELLVKEPLDRNWLPQWPAALLIPVFAGVTLTWWVGQCAQLWARTWPGRSPRRAIRLVLTTTAVLWTSWFQWWSEHERDYFYGTSLERDALRAMFNRLPSPPDGHDAEQTAARLFYAFASQIHPLPLAVVALTAAWVVPLLAWCVRPPSSVPRWVRTALRDSGHPRPHLGPLPPISPVLRHGLSGAALASVTVLCVQAYLHTWKPPANRGSNWHLVIFQVEVLASVLAGTIVAAAAASATSRQYRLVFALAAGQLAFGWGSVAAFVSASMDGCLGPLNAVSGSCHWRSDAAITSFSAIVIPAALAGAILSACVALVSGAVYRCRRDRHLETAAGRPQPAGTIEDLRKRRLAVGGTTILAVLAATIVGVHATPTDTGGVGHGAASTPQPITRDNTVSPRLRAAQVAAWYYVGGGDKLQAIANAVRDLARTELEPQPEDERILASCNALQALAAQADAFFHLPDTVLQQTWQQIIGQTDRGATACLQAVRALDLSPTTLSSDQEESLNALFNHGIIEIMAAGQNATDLLAQILAAFDPYFHSVVSSPR
ncbi:M56 family metallopeptidase [Nocardia niigatensis]